MLYLLTWFLIFFCNIDFIDIKKYIIYGMLFLFLIFGRLFTDIIDSFIELNPIVFLMFVPFVYYYALNI
jgi:hypothetical protein